MERKELDEINEKLDKVIEINICGWDIKFTRYDFQMFLDEFCYFLKEEGITGLGREDMIEGFIASEKCRDAIDKFIDSKRK
jgi:hypothetical protein